MARLELYLRIRYAWWFGWLYLPAVALVYWSGQILGIDSDPRPFIARVLPYAVRVEQITEYERPF